MSGLSLRVLVLSLLCGCTLEAAGKLLAIVDVQVYPSSTANPLPHATILIESDRIASVGTNLRIPRAAQVIHCNGCTAMAGFWNCHIHFTEPKWNNAATQPAPQLSRNLQSMLTHSGFTTVVDTASSLLNTLAIRSRIESGEVAGPQIFTAGTPLYPPNGVPYYVKETLPAAILRQIKPPEDPRQAAAMEAANIRDGADLLKLFTGSWVARGKVAIMPEPIAKAAADVAHAYRQLAFAHPSNLAGVRVAIDSGVDVLAHAPDDTRGVDDALIRRLVDRHMAMIPTLKLFSGEDTIAHIRDIVHRFQSSGGQLLFGTDTGYLTDYDVSGEFRQLTQAGLSARQILGMLTENPAARFRLAKERGQIAPGMKADLTVVEGDPAKDVAAFTRVRYTIRNGRIIYTHP